MWFYHRFLRIIWTEELIKEDALGKIGTRKKLAFEIRKLHLIFLNPILRKEYLENLTLHDILNSREAGGISEETD